VKYLSATFLKKVIDFKFDLDYTKIIRNDLITKTKRFRQMHTLKSVNFIVDEMTRPEVLPTYNLSCRDVKLCVPTDLSRHYDAIEVFGDVNNLMRFLIDTDNIAMIHDIADFDPNFIEEPLESAA